MFEVLVQARVFFVVRLCVLEAKYAGFLRVSWELRSRAAGSSTACNNYRRTFYIFALYRQRGDFSTTSSVTSGILRHSTFAVTVYCTTRQHLPLKGCGLYSVPSCGHSIMRSTYPQGVFLGIQSLFDFSAWRARELAPTYRRPP